MQYIFNIYILNTYIQSISKNFHFGTPLCVPSDSDPNFQKSYQNLITFLGEILPNSDSKFWLGGNNKGGKLQLNFWNWQKQRYTLNGGLMSVY